MKGIFIGIGVAALCITALSTVNNIIVKELMKIALDREESKLFSISKNHIMRSEELSSALKKISKASENLYRSNCEEICIESRDGIKLVGHWRKCKNAKRIIIAKKRFTVFLLSLLEKLDINELKTYVHFVNNYIPYNVN